MSIEKLLRPNTLAVIGASEKEGFGGDACRNIMSLMDEGKFYFVNPKRETVFGIKCYPDLRAIPGDIDLVVICTPQKTVIPLLTQALDKKVGGAVVYASGYSEVGSEEGQRAEEELVSFCRTHDIALMGPNCAGFMNFADSVSSFAFISKERNRQGTVGFVSQSGQLVLSAMDRAGTGFSYVISAGNANIVSIEDYLNFLIDDEQTRVISMYVEGIKNPQAFVRALDKASVAGKPVVILKTGKSEKAQALAASHTGSLSGSDEVYDAVFEKYGVIRVDDLEELTSTAQALSILSSYPVGDGLACVSLSGGETGICADLGDVYGLKFPELEAETMNQLRTVLPSYATPNNPLDITATLSYDTEKFAHALEILMKDPKVSMISIGYSLLEEIADNAIFYMSKAMALVSGQPWSKPMIVTPFIETTRNEDYYQQLRSIGVPVLPTSSYAFKITGHIFNYSSYNREDHTFPGGSDLPPSETDHHALSEGESKRYLMDQGLAIDEFGIAGSREEAVELFEKIQSQSSEPVKVVAKIESKDILHKSDIGGVKLNLTNPDEVGDAYETILRNAGEKCPGAEIAGVQITRMLDPGIEMIIGIKNDPSFGPVIMCGLGGVFVEIFRDVSLRLAPISPKEARDMIDMLKARKMLEGYRGSQIADVDSLCDLMVQVSHLAYDKKNELIELDLNPVFVHANGVSIADALVIKTN